MIVVTLVCVLAGGVAGRMEYLRRTGELQRQEMKEIAKKEAKSRDGWAGELKVDLVETKSGWHAWVWRVPETPGGFVVVTISTAKKVTEYSKGK